MGALKNDPRISIGLEAIASDGDLFREITEVGIQVSEALVSEWVLITRGYPILTLLMCRQDMVSASPANFRQEREHKQATEVSRSGRRVTLHPTLPCLWLPSEFKRGKLRGRTQRDARRRVAQRDEKLCTIQFGRLFTVLSANKGIFRTFTPARCPLDA